jgi:cell division ATPase FtsA
MVETAVRTNRMTYIDAIVWICEKNNIEIEDIKKYLNTSIVENLEKEAMDLNILPKVNTLDV